MPAALSQGNQNQIKSANQRKSMPANPDAENQRKINIEDEGYRLAGDARRQELALQIRNRDELIKGLSEEILRAKIEQESLLRVQSPQNTQRNSFRSRSLPRRVRSGNAAA